MDAYREPCPARIVTDCGGAFAMGAIGGSLWHAFKGFRSGLSGSRLSSSIYAMRLNGPRTGGSFAVWMGLYSSFDCTLAGMRAKEDPWNSISSGALAGGVLSARTGFMGSAKAALFGGISLALIEGGIFVMTRKAPDYGQYAPTVMDEDVLDSGEDNGWFSPIRKLFTKEENQTQEERTFEEDTSIDIPREFQVSTSKDATNDDDMFDDEEEGEWEDYEEDEDEYALN